MSKSPAREQLFEREPGNQRSELTGLLLKLQIKLARAAMTDLDSKRISDLSGLLKADAAAAKVQRETGGEAKPDYKELRRLINQEYGISDDT
ncbi:MAG: hypothetical protein ACE5GM_04985 [bacterium]